MYYNESYNLILNGSYIESVSTLYETAFGYLHPVLSNFFWSFLFISIVFMLFIKTRDPAVFAWYLVLAALYLSDLMGTQYDFVMWLAIVLAIAFWLYSMFTKRNA